MNIRSISKLKKLTLGMISMLLLLSSITLTGQALTGFYMVGDMGSYNFNSVSTSYDEGWAYGQTDGDYKMKADAEAQLDYDNDVFHGGWVVSQVSFTFNIGYLSQTHDLTDIGFLSSSIVDYYLYNALPTDVYIDTYLQLIRGNTVIKTSSHQEWYPSHLPNQAQTAMTYNDPVDLVGSMTDTELSGGYTYKLKLIVEYEAYGHYLGITKENAIWKYTQIDNDYYSQGSATLWYNIEVASSGGCVYFNGRWYC